MILKNVAGQGIYLFCVQTVSAPYTGTAGDQANITGHYSLDGGVESSFSTTNPTNIGGGVYWQPLAQAETNGNTYSYRWISSTTGNVINPSFGTTSGINLPNIAYNSSGGLITSGTGTGQLSVSSGDVVVVGNTPQTGDVFAALPTHFSALVIDSSGHLILQSTGLDLIVKDTYTLPQLIALIAAAVMAKISGLPSSPATVRSVDDAADRIVTAFDANNNRTSVTLTAP